MLNEHQLTASLWYEGQASAMYSYACTETKVAGLEAEVKRCLELATSAKECAKLSSFYAYIAEPVSIESVATATEFWHRTARDSRGYPVRCRKNGQLKLWKTRPTEFRLPVKYGLKECFYLTEFNASDWVVAP
jgi:hypothetical protein